MQRILPETNLEQKMMCMGAVFVEENHVLDDLFEIIGSDLVEGTELTGEVREQVLEEVAEYFFRLDLNWGHEIKADCIGILEEYWGVKSREQALATLENIRQQGHRTKFSVLKSFIPPEGPLRASELEKFKQVFNFDFSEEQNLQMDDEAYQKLAAWMQRTDKYISACGILGWDVARFVHLVRLSFVSGYIDDNEAWGEILKMAPLAESKFKNWLEFSQSFLIGRTFGPGAKIRR